MKKRVLILWLILHVLVVFPQEQPEIIILTDIGGDPDDQQSMVRLLLYSDMLDIKAIGVTSRMNHGQDIKPELVFEQIEAYREVYSRLKLHSDGFPEPDSLVAVVKKGQGNQYNFGEGFDTEASEAVIKIVDKTKDIVHIAVWGGQRELAQALWKIQTTRNKDELAEFCQKIQVHAIADQDKYRDWIMNNFGSKVRYIANAFVSPGTWGIREISVCRGMYMTGNTEMQNAEWVKTFVYGHGPLSECYPLNGHGTDGMKEGDTPSFLGLISNGLNSPENPEWGGWGGRFRHLNRNIYIDASDFLDGTLNERHTVSRWRLAFQHDFMARLNWCIEPYEKANHNPEVVVNNSAGHKPLFVNTQGGEKIVFDALKSHDPDGNDLSYRWFFYNEISFAECAKLKLSSGGAKCTVKIPWQLNGRDLHLILEVNDNGNPSLTSYKRIIISVL